MLTLHASSNAAQRHSVNVLNVLRVLVSCDDASTVTSYRFKNTGIALDYSLPPMNALCGVRERKSDMVIIIIIIIVIIILFAMSK